MADPDLNLALRILEQGGVVGVPTETVYGLAARIDRPEGIQKIFAVKERPFFDPLIVHVASIDQARTCVSDWPEIAQTLAEAFWPGPLTLILPKSPSISPLITSGLTTVGLRCPRHPVALELIRQVGVPLAAPSANRFGRTSPTRADHVRSEFQNQVTVLEGGPSEVGIESTIVAVEASVLKLLRPGILSPEEISDVLSKLQMTHRWEQPSGKTEAPGQMQHHYMPEKPLLIFSRLPVSEDWSRVAVSLSELPQEIEGVRIHRPEEIKKRQELVLSESPVIAAREVYQALRETAKTDADILFLIWPVHKRSGPWSAIWDRLKKAASLQID